MSNYRNIAISEDNYNFLKSLALLTKTPNKALNNLRLSLSKIHKNNPKEALNKIIELSNSNLISLSELKIRLDKLEEVVYNKDVYV